LSKESNKSIDIAQLVAIWEPELRVFWKIPSVRCGSAAAVQPQARFPHDYVCYTPVSGPLIIVIFQFCERQLPARADIKVTHL